MRFTCFFLAFLSGLLVVSCGGKTLSIAAGKQGATKETPAIYQLPYTENADEYEVGLTPETQALMNTIDSLKKIYIPEKEELFLDTFTIGVISPSGDSSTVTESTGWKTSEVHPEKITGKHTYQQYKLISVFSFANNMQMIKYEKGSATGDLYVFEIYYLDASGKIFGYEKGPSQECTYLFNADGVSTWSLCIEAPSGSFELKSAESEPYNGPVTYAELVAKYELGELLAGK